MLQVLIGGLLVVHGLITTAIGAGSLADDPRDGPGVPNPAWLSWWPAPLGRSWLLDALPFGAGITTFANILWLAAGLMLIAAGIGFLEVPVLQESWPSLAIAGAALGLVVLVLYFHPYYVLAVLLNAAILVLVVNQLRAASGNTPV